VTVEKNVPKKRAPANRTIVLGDADRAKYRPRLQCLHRPAAPGDIVNATLCQDLYQAAEYLPENFVDLLFLDPPYNLNKSFGERSFSRMKPDDYGDWLDSWLRLLVRTLKPQASVYICGTWDFSAAVQRAAGKYFRLRSRITWEREKGRGQRQNWKNCAEDIWFYTCGRNYTFNAGMVKLKRRVLAPYTGTDGKPKDWQPEKDGNYRLTAPSNLWSDITVPFWSMPENTDHPAQKPEKLLARIILASSNEGDMVFDPFLGSGTTSVVARKLGRRYLGIEIDETYACLAEKRLEMAAENTRIQGYEGGVFWERNSNTGHGGRSR
jgi:DNA modification methylase